MIVKRYDILLPNGNPKFQPACRQAGLVFFPIPALKFIAVATAMPKNFAPAYRQAGWYGKKSLP